MLVTSSRGSAFFSWSKRRILLIATFRHRFAQQSLPQKVFSAIWEVESEVNNGGFAQYFSNDSAESASFVVEALEKIGAPKNCEYLPSCDSHCIS
jgi:hypothetical protein